MKARNILPLVVLLTGGLTACNGKGDLPSMGGGGSSNGSNNQPTGAEHWEYPDVDGSPAPECIPQNAPEDYLNVTPAEADPYDAFFYISHKRANSDYLAVAYGEALGQVGSLGSYTQKISSMTLQADTTTFQIFASTGDIEVLPGASGLQIPTVNRAARSFEDIEKGIYAGQETSEGADITLDEDPVEGEFAGHVSSWGSPQRVPNRQGLLDEYGHDLFSFSAYYVPDRTAIASASMAPEGSDAYTFNFNFSLIDDGNYTDAAIYYRNTLNQGVAEGLVQFTITELTMKATVDRDWNLLRTTSIERYNVAVASLVDVPVTNTTDTYVYNFKGLDNCPNKEALSYYNEAVQAAGLESDLGLAQL